MKKPPAWKSSRQTAYNLLFLWMKLILVIVLPEFFHTPNRPCCQTEGTDTERMNSIKHSCASLSKTFPFVKIWYDNTSIENLCHSTSGITMYPGRVSAWISRNVLSFRLRILFLRCPGPFIPAFCRFFLPRLQLCFDRLLFLSARRPLLPGRVPLRNFGLLTGYRSFR